MKQIKYFALLLTVVLTLGCVACGNDKDDKKEDEPAVWSIVGTWLSEDEEGGEYWTFTQDGRLTMCFTDMGEQYTENVYYKLEGNKLTIRDNDGNIGSMTITHTENSFTIVEDGITFHRVS